MFQNHSDCSQGNCFTQQKYFEIAKNFKELTTEVQKAQARHNLGIGDEQSLKWGNIKGFIEKQKDLTQYLNNYKPELGEKLDKHISDTNNPHNITKTQVGLSNVTNDAQVKRSEMGVTGGVATLDGDGKVPALQLPSDEEDVTVVDGKIKFNDRDTTNGMGYVILRKNKSFVGQVTKSNTIYEIRYKFDLNGETFNIPANCKFITNGGCIFNGRLKGELLNDYVTPQMFGAKADGITNDTLAFQNAIAVSHHVIVPNGTYIVTGMSSDKYSFDTQDGIWIYKSNFTLEFSPNATLIKVGECPESWSRKNRNIIDVMPEGGEHGDERLYNIKILNGRLIGNRKDFSTTSTEENNCGVGFFNTENSIIDGTHISDNYGDSVIFYNNKNLTIKNVISERSRRTGFSIGDCDGVTIENCISKNDGADWSYNGKLSKATLPKNCICWEYESQEHDGHEINKTIIRNNKFFIDDVKSPILIGNCRCTDYITIENNDFYMDNDVALGTSIIEAVPTNGFLENLIISNNRFKYKGTAIKWFVRAYKSIKNLVIQNNTIENSGLLDLYVTEIGTPIDTISVIGNNVITNLPDLTPNFIQSVGGTVNILNISNNISNTQNIIIFQQVSEIKTCNILGNNFISPDIDNITSDSIFGNLTSFKNLNCIGNCIESGTQYLINAKNDVESLFVLKNNKLKLKGSIHYLNANWTYFPCIIDGNIIEVTSSVESFKFSGDFATTGKTIVTNNLFRGRLEKLIDDSVSDGSIINQGNIKI